MIDIRKKARIIQNQDGCHMNSIKQYATHRCGHAEAAHCIEDPCMCNQSEAACLRRRHSDPADEPGTRLLHLLSEAAVADLHELKLENLLLHPFFSFPCPVQTGGPSTNESEVLCAQLSLSNLAQCCEKTDRGWLAARPWQ
jgi:hypothetical protein